MDLLWLEGPDAVWLHIFNSAPGQHHIPILRIHFSFFYLRMSFSFSLFKFCGFFLNI